MGESAYPLKLPTSAKAAAARLAKADGVSLNVIVDWLVDAGHTIARIDDYEEWFARFERGIRALPEKQKQYSLLPLLHAFAQNLFGLTDIGLRVIIVRDDIAPRDIEHPALFKPSPSRPEVALATPPTR